MIVFLADGRLGNQLFQYVFIKTIARENEKIIVTGFDEIIETFNISDVLNLSTNNRWIRAFLFRICRPILTYLSKFKIIKSIVVNRERILGGYFREAKTYKLSQGVFKNITFIKLGFFQSEAFFDTNVVKRLELKSKHISNALDVLSSVSEEYFKVFVHIRRSDYIGYKVYGRSTLLPISYFKDQVERFQGYKKNCFFIFLSDQPELIHSEFGYLENKLISKNNHYSTDFAIMTQCNGAILSPSSFGWWGSYMMKEMNVVVAPKYWLGFGSKEEYHSGAVPSYAEEITILDVSEKKN